MSVEKITSMPSEVNKLDPWPQNADGSNWNGAGLLPLLAQEKSPFGDALDVRSLMDELEHALGERRIDDIPVVTFGANHFVSLPIVAPPFALLTFTRASLCS